MKIPLLLCSALIASQLLYSQAPKGPGGNSLYKKGDCSRAGVDFNVCTYCEDIELKKNCKEYWCTDNGTCSEAPLKKPNELLEYINVGGAKYIAFGKDDTTSKLPRGVKTINGKTVVLAGYKTVYSSNNKMIFILSNNGNGVNGVYVCGCGESTGGTCTAILVGNTVKCKGDDCCLVAITVGSLTGLTMQDIEQAPEKLTWKKVVLPTKSN